MKYLCLIYFEENNLEAMTDKEVGAMISECHAYDVELQKNGQLIACERLEPIHTATTVRMRNGHVSMTDGPFAETKEQLGGFFLITARDLNGAIQIASNLPQARLGCIEVRPIRELKASSIPQ